MTTLIQLLQILLLAFAGLFACGWLVHFLGSSRLFLARFFGRRGPAPFRQPTWLALLRQWMIRIWCGAVLSMALLITCTLIQEQQQQRPPPPPSELPQHPAAPQP